MAFVLNDPLVLIHLKLQGINTAASPVLAVHSILQDYLREQQLIFHEITFNLGDDAGEAGYRREIQALLSRLIKYVFKFVSILYPLKNLKSPPNPM